MNEKPPRPPSTGTDRRRRSRHSGALRWPFWLALVLLIGAVAWFLMNVGRRDVATVDTEIEATDIPEELPSGDRAVILVFPEWDASGYLTERRRIPSRGLPEEDLQAVVAELIAGPTASGAVRPLPERATLLSVFLDSEERHAVLDFSSELVTRHPGGSAGELATLTSLLRTVALNFPSLETCRVLVDGAAVETLAGHLALDAPFELRRWL